MKGSTRLVGMNAGTWSRAITTGVTTGGKQQSAPEPGDVERP